MKWWEWMAAAPIGVLVAWLLWSMLRTPAEPAPVAARVRGTGRGYAVEVVGESYRADNLQRILGSLAGTEDEWTGEAELVLEDGNPHDPQAVLVTVQGLPVGYLSRDDARSFRRRLAEAGGAHRRLTVSAMICGGGPERLFSVALDLPVE